MNKQKYCILTDSSVRINKLTNIPNLFIYPLKLSINNIDYTDDGKSISYEELINFQKSTYIKTSQGSINEFEIYIQDLLNKFEKIYFFAIGKKFSGLIDNIKNLSKKYKNFLIINTNNIYIGIYYAILKALPLIQNNESINNIQSTIDEFMKKSYYLFVLNNTSYIAKSGRINKLTGILSNFLKIKIVFKFNNSNTSIIDKTRTIKTAWSNSLNTAKNLVNDIDKYLFTYFYSHIDKNDIIQYFNEAKEIFSDNLKGPFQLSLILASHIGPGAVGLFICPKI